MGFKTSVQHVERCMFPAYLLKDKSFKIQLVLTLEYVYFSQMSSQMSWELICSSLPLAVLDFIIYIDKISIRHAGIVLV